MKKLLLTTTSLSFMAFAGSALAEMPKVTVGGELDGQYVFTSQESEFEKNFFNNGAEGGATGEVIPSRYSKNVHSAMDTSIYFKVDGKLDSGLSYGAFVNLNADIGGDYGYTGNNNADETYLYLDTGTAGMIKLGSMYSTAYNMTVDASSIAHATGGIKGDFYKYVDLTNDSNITSGTTTDVSANPVDIEEDNANIIKGRISEGTFLVTPDLPTTAFPQSADHENYTANKISYTSPMISGFQFGASYTPDYDEVGSAAQLSADKFGSFENIIDFGLTYTTEYQDFLIKASVTGEFGSAKTTGYSDISAFAFGAEVGYQGFKFAGSYAFANDFGQVDIAKAEYNYFTAGAAYENGPFGVSLTFLSSTVKNAGNINQYDAPVAELPNDTATGYTDSELANIIRASEFIVTGEDHDFMSVSFGADYKLAEGFLPYAEVTYFDADDNVSGTSDNSGFVVLVGAKVNF